MLCVWPLPITLGWGPISYPHGKTEVNKTVLSPDLSSFLDDMCWSLSQGRNREFTSFVSHVSGITVLCRLSALFWKPLFNIFCLSFGCFRWKGKYGPCYWKFFLLFFSNSSSFLTPFSGTPITSMLDSLMLSHSSLKLCSFFFFRLLFLLLYYDSFNYHVQLHRSFFLLYVICCYSLPMYFSCLILSFFIFLVLFYLFIYF